MKPLATLVGAAANAVPAVIDATIAASFAIRIIVRLLGMKLKTGLAERFKFAEVGARGYPMCRPAMMPVDGRMYPSSQ